jgi:hypothetical protein
MRLSLTRQADREAINLISLVNGWGNVSYRASGPTKAKMLSRNATPDHHATVEPIKDTARFPKL